MARMARRTGTCGSIRNMPSHTSLHTVDDLKKCLVHSIVFEIGEGVCLLSFRILSRLGCVTDLAVIGRNDDIEFVVKVFKVVFMTRRVLAVAFKAPNDNRAQGRGDHFIGNPSLQNWLRQPVLGRCPGVARS